MQTSQEQVSMHKIKNLSEIVTKAIVKAEKDNDEMLSRIKNARINQIVSAMLQVEKSNDIKIKEMTSTLSEYELNSHIEEPYNLNGWSSEMTAQLR